MSPFPFWTGLLPVSYGAVRARNNYEDRSNPIAFTAITSAIASLKAYASAPAHPKEIPPPTIGTRMISFGIMVAGSLAVNIASQYIGEQIAFADQAKNRELR